MARIGRYFKLMVECATIIGSMALITLSCSVQAAAHCPHTELEVGLEISHFRYNETVPDHRSHQQTFFMRDIGYFAGIAASWGYYGSYMMKLDGVFKAGRVNYTSSGSGCESGIHDDILDVRGLIGWNVYRDCNRITPFIGFGYRYLYDNLYNHGKLLLGRYWGYDREANYFYSPLGVEFERILSSRWSIGATAEYDQFWHGIQISHFEQYEPDQTMLINRQNNGWGARGTLRFLRRIDNSHRQLLIEPFVRYWHISRSKKGAALYHVDQNGRRLYVCGAEPNNTTTAFGLTIASRFCGL